MHFNHVQLYIGRQEQKILRLHVHYFYTCRWKGYDGDGAAESESLRSQRSLTEYMRTPTSLLYRRRVINLIYNSFFQLNHSSSECHEPDPSRCSPRFYRLLDWYIGQEVNIGGVYNGNYIDPHTCPILVELLETEKFSGIAWIIISAFPNKLSFLPSKVNLRKTIQTGTRRKRRQSTPRTRWICPIRFSS